MMRKRDQLREWIRREQPTRIGEEEWTALIERELAPVSESYLRRLVRECGLPLDPFVEGVRQSSLAELERSLTALAGLYAASAPERQRQIRRLVIQAKDRARWRGGRDENVLWMLTWLENPAIFPAWAVLRVRALGASHWQVIGP
jgi:hypothetical protein